MHSRVTGSRVPPLPNMSLQMVQRNLREMMTVLVQECPKPGTGQGVGCCNLPKAPWLLDTHSSQRSRGKMDLFLTIKQNKPTNKQNLKHAKN